MKTFFRFACAFAAFVFCAAALPAESTDGAEVYESTGSVKVTGTSEKDRATLSVKTNIEKVEVYLDGVYYGMAPVALRDISPGLRRLELRRDGYYRKTWKLRIERGTDTEIYAELRQVTGVLSVTGLPEGFVIESGNSSFRENRIELPAGLRTITLRAFGYKDRSETVMIEPRGETTLEAKLEKAAFAVTALRVSRAAFNPQNPAALGCADIMFTVSAPGAGKISITDASGPEVFQVAVGPFDDWNQSIRWNGRRADGSVLPDGDYDIVLEAAGKEAGAETVSARSRVRIDASISYPLTGLLWGTGATGRVVSASLLPAGGAMMLAEAGLADSAGSYGLSAAIGCTRNVEAGFEVSAVTLGGYTLPVVSGAAKAGFDAGDFRLAMAVRYSAVTSQDGKAGPDTRRGFAAGPAFEYRAGPFTIGVSAGIQYGDRNGLFESPWASAEGGAAVRFGTGLVSVGLWGNAETGELGSASMNSLSVSSGISAQALIPQTNLVVTCRGGFTRSAAAVFLPSVSGGFGVIF